MDIQAPRKDQGAAFRRDSLWQGDCQHAQVLKLIRQHMYNISLALLHAFRTFHLTPLSVILKLFHYLLLSRKKRAERQGGKK